MATATRADRSRDRRGVDDKESVDQDMTMLNRIRMATREENTELNQGMGGVARATAELGGRVQAIETEV